MQPDLATTLMRIVEAAMPDVAGIAVTSAEIEMPLEITLARSASGNAVLLARAPHSRWRAGLLPPVHRARIVVGPEEA
jgi:hypothetical protein